MIDTLLGTEHGLGYRLVQNEPIVEYFREWRGHLASKMPRPDDLFLTVPFLAVRSRQKRIVQAVRAVFRRKQYKELLYTRAQFENEVPGLKQSLADGFPVNYYWEESRVLRTKRKM